MIYKKSFRKMVTILVFAFVLCSFSIGAFAQGIPTYTTTTKYNIADPEYIEVTSTVINLQSGEQVTYIAYKADTLDEVQADPQGTIAYIDQDVTDVNGSKTFTYKTKTDKINSVVKFGSESTPSTGITPQEDDDGKLSDYTITVNITGEGKVNGVGDGGTIKVGRGENVTLIFEAGYAHTLPNSFKLDEEDKTLAGNYLLSDIMKDYTVSVAFTPKETLEDSSIVVSDTPTTRIVGEEATPEEKAQNTITTFGKVESAATDMEYGILFTTENLEATDFEYGKPNVTAFKSLGKGKTGLFAIELLDGGSGKITADTTYYTKTYLKIGEEFKYSDPVVINGQ